MDWLEEVQEKQKRKNQMLFSRDTPLFRGLNLLIEGQSRRVLVLWALDLAEETVEELETRYPLESRPRQALEASRLWAEGKLKMSLAGGLFWTVTPWPRS